MASNKPEPMIGDVYEDKYKGESNRTVKVIEQAEVDWKRRPRWVCETLTNDGRPHLIGTRTVIAAHTLQQSFRKLER